MPKPSLAEALGGYDKPAESGHGGDDAEMYVTDLAAALGVKEDKARQVYDCICAIVEAKLHSGWGRGVTVTVE